MEDVVINSILLALFNLPVIIEFLSYLSVYDILKMLYLIKDSNYDEKLFLRYAKKKLDRYDRLIIKRIKKLNGIFYKNIYRDLYPNAEVILFNAEHNAFNNRQLTSLILSCNFDNILFCKRFLLRRDITVEMLEDARVRNCSMEWRFNYRNENLFEQVGSSQIFLAKKTFLDWLVINNIQNEMVLCLVRPSQLLNVLQNLDISLDTYCQNATVPIIEDFAPGTCYMELFNYETTLNLSIYVNYFPVRLLDGFSERFYFEKICQELLTVNSEKMLLKKSYISFSKIISIVSFESIKDYLRENDFQNFSNITCDEIKLACCIHHGSDLIDIYYTECLISLSLNTTFWIYLGTLEDNLPFDLYLLLSDIVLHKTFKYGNMLEDIILNPNVLKNFALIFDDLSNFTSVNLSNSNSTLFLDSLIHLLIDNNFELYYDNYPVFELRRENQKRYIINYWNNIDNMESFDEDMKCQIWLNTIMRVNSKLYRRLVVRYFDDDVLNFNVRRTLAYIGCTKKLIDFFAAIGKAVHFRLVLASLIINNDSDSLTDYYKVLIVQNFYYIPAEFKDANLKVLHERGRLLELLGLFVKNCESGLFSLNWEFERFKIESIKNMDAWQQNVYEQIFIISLIYGRFDIKSLVFMGVGLSEEIKNMEFLKKFQIFQFYDIEELEVIAEVLTLDVEQKMEYMYNKIFQFRSRVSDSVMYLDELY